MDLWIRSQNKMTLSKARDLRLFKIADEWHIRAIWNDDINPCAEYSTKEKALKVLDEIQKFINHWGADQVYEMPADDEVK